MRATFSADADVGRSLLRLHMAGFFSIDDVRALAEARNAALKQLKCGPNQHLTLCDAREALLSKTDVAAEFQRLLADPRYASRKLAYVTDGALLRMQAARVLDRPNLRFFTDPAAAERWLLDEDDAEAV